MKVVRITFIPSHPHQGFSSQRLSRLKVNHPRSQSPIRPADGSARRLLGFATVPLTNTLSDRNARQVSELQ
jgi:hypothetical protein